VTVAELVKAIATDARCTRWQARQMLETLGHVAGEVLRHGEPLLLPHLGVLYRATRKPREVRGFNGARVVLAEQHQVALRASKHLKAVRP
jgi:nucleoid DNA-binding protein